MTKQQRREKQLKLPRGNSRFSLFRNAANIHNENNSIAVGKCKGKAKQKFCASHVAKIKALEN